jgi:hypothetical protein
MCQRNFWDFRLQKARGGKSDHAKRSKRLAFWRLLLTLQFAPGARCKMQYCDAIWPVKKVDFHINPRNFSWHYNRYEGGEGHGLLSLVSNYRATQLQLENETVKGSFWH